MSPDTSRAGRLPTVRASVVARVCDTLSFQWKQGGRLVCRRDDGRRTHARQSSLWFGEATVCARHAPPLQILVPNTTRSTVPHVSPVDRESVDDPELQAMFEQLEQLEGSFPDHYLYELNFRPYLKAKLEATVTLWEEGELTMPEVQHVGIAVSRANECQNCTGAFCTVLSHGLDVAPDYVETFLEDGTDAVDDERLRAILEYALLVNDDPSAVTDTKVQRLRDAGLGDRGIVQLTHLVSDFVSWNRTNDALDTEYEYDRRWLDAAGLDE